MAKFDIPYIEVSYSWLSMQLISGERTAATQVLALTCQSPLSLSSLCFLCVFMYFRFVHVFSGYTEIEQTCQPEHRRREKEDPEDRLSERLAESTVLTGIALNPGSTLKATKMWLNSLALKGLIPELKWKRGPSWDD